MKEFFDTSVLVAAFRREHVHHVPSLKRFAAGEKRHSACGLHSFAEVFSVMTALPVKPMIPPEQALLFVEEVRNRLTLVSLSTEEYFAAIQNTASRGFTGGRIYDSLLLAQVRHALVIQFFFDLKRIANPAPAMAAIETAR